MKKTFHRKYKWPLNTKRCLKFIIIEEIHTKITCLMGVTRREVCGKAGFLTHWVWCELKQSSRGSAWFGNSCQSYRCFTLQPSVLIIKWHKMSGFIKQKFIISQFWKPEVWNQDVISRVNRMNWPGFYHCGHTPQVQKKIACFAPTGVAQWVGHCPANQRSLVWFPLRAHTWVVGQAPGWGWGGCERQHITHQCSSPSLSPPLPLSLK